MRERDNPSVITCTCDQGSFWTGGQLATHKSTSILAEGLIASDVLKRGSAFGRVAVGDDAYFVDCDKQRKIKHRTRLYTPMNLCSGSIPSLSSCSEGRSRYGSCGSWRWGVMVMVMGRLQCTASWHQRAIWIQSSKSCNLGWLEVRLNRPISVDTSPRS